MSVPPYFEGSPQFTEMLCQGEAVGTPDEGLYPGAILACYALAKSYEHGSSRFCQDWYECFILNQVTPAEYRKRAALIDKCLNQVKNAKSDGNLNSVSDSYIIH